MKNESAHTIKKAEASSSYGVMNPTDEHPARYASQAFQISVMNPLRIIEKHPLFVSQLIGIATIAHVRVAILRHRLRWEEAFMFSLEMFIHELLSEDFLALWADPETSDGVMESHKGGH